jgi:hypothetical protein
MVKRKVTLPDGRYLIFYTFDDQAENRLDPRSQAPTSEAKEPGARACETGHTPECRKTDK